MHMDMDSRCGVDIQLHGRGTLRSVRGVLPVPALGQAAPRLMCGIVDLHATTLTCFRGARIAALPAASKAARVIMQTAVHMVHPCGESKT